MCGSLSPAWLSNTESLKLRDSRITTGEVGNGLLLLRGGRRLYFIGALKLLQRAPFGNRIVTRKFLLQVAFQRRQSIGLVHLTVHLALGVNLPERLFDGIRA